MGLGNSYYELGDIKNFEDAFRETIRLHPQAGSAYNNLAQILMEQGRYTEALEMARKAVSLGGPFQAVYRQTLKEIEFKILVKFIEKHLYHIIIDEDENRISERWFPTAKDETGRYSVKLKVKKEFYFQPGKKYRLCIGSQHPDAVYYYTNTYKCYADYEFVLPEKK